MGKTLRDVFGHWQAHEVEDRNRKTPCGADLNRQKNLGVSDADAQRRVLADGNCQASSLLQKTHSAGPTDRLTHVPLESDLHDQVLEWFHSRGYLAVHSRMDAKTTTAKGVCDVIGVTPEIVVFVELKRKGNKPTKEQLAFLAHVKKMGWPNAVIYSYQEFLDFIATWH